MSRNPFKSSAAVPEPISETASAEQEPLPEITKPTGFVFLNLGLSNKRMIVPSSVDAVRGGSPTTVILQNGFSVTVSRYTAEQVAAVLRESGLPMILFQRQIGPGVLFRGDPIFVNLNALIGVSSNPELILHLRGSSISPGIQSADVESVLKQQLGTITYADPERDQVTQMPTVPFVDAWTASRFVWKG